MVNSAGGDTADSLSPARRILTAIREFLATRPGKIVGGAIILAALGYVSIWLIFARVTPIATLRRYSGE
jgi:hypothetical protein